MTDSPDLQYRDVRVLVLGAAGFIGRWLSRRLTAAGADLHLVVRNKDEALKVFRPWGIRGELHVTDLADPGATTHTVTGLAPTICFNLAGYGVDPHERDRKTSELLNAELPGLLVDALAPIRVSSWPGQSVIHVGTAQEYGTVSGDLSEGGPTQATTLYGRTKLAGTQRFRDRCLEHDFAGLTARLFSVYGAGEHEGRLLPSLVQASLSGDPVDLSAGTQQRDFTFVGEVVDGLLRLGLGDRIPGGVVNLATGILTPVREFVEIAAGVLGLSEDQLNFEVLPTPAEEMAHEPVNISLLKNHLDWVPGMGIPEGIVRSIEILEET